MTKNHLENLCETLSSKFIHNKNITGIGYSMPNIIIINLLNNKEKKSLKKYFDSDIFKEKYANIEFQFKVTGKIKLL